MTYRQVNRHFTLVCFALPPVAGSAVSFLWHGGALWCAAAILSGRRRFSPDRPMWLLALLMAVHVAANVIAFFCNPWTGDDLVHLLALATFLLFPFSYSLWTVSRKEEIAEAAVRGGVVASFGALALALVQQFVMALRPEGGAGNALVFAHVACISGLVCLAGALLLGRGRMWLLLLAFSAALAAVLLSGARAVSVVMIAAGLLLLLLERRKFLLIFKKGFLTAALILLVIGATASGVVFERIGLIGADLSALALQGDHNTSIGQRIALYEIGLKLVGEAPLIGHGVQRTFALTSQYLGADYGVDRGFTHFHNGFLNSFVEGGVFAGLSVVAIFAAILVIAVRGLKNERAPATRFGATLLVIVFATYAGAGSLNLIFGHDIMDSVFMVVLITGLYLAAGTSRLEPGRPAALDEGPDADGAPQTRP